MNSFNKWAETVRASSRYVPPKDTPQGYYFDTEVFKNNLSQKTKNSIMKMLKKFLGIAIVTFTLTSCSQYTVMSNGHGCGYKMKKKFTGMPKVRGNAHMVSF